MACLSATESNLQKEGYTTSGSVYAAAISSWLSFLAQVLFFKLHSSFQNYDIFSMRNPNGKNIIKTLLLLGLPIGLQNGISFLYIFVQSIFAGRLGTSSLAANQVINQYSSLIHSFIFANSEVNGIFSGKDISEAQGNNLKNIYLISHLFSLAAPISLGLIIFPSAYEDLTNLFVDSSDTSYNDILNIARWLFLINGLSNVFDGVRQSSIGFLQGFYDIAMPTFIVLSLLWSIGLPSSLALAFPAELGIYGILIGYTISVAISTPILMKRSYDAAKSPDATLEKAKNNFTHNLYSMFKCIVPCNLGNSKNERYLPLEEINAEESIQDEETQEEFVSNSLETSHM